MDKQIASIIRIAIFTLIILGVYFFLLRPNFVSKPAPPPKQVEWRHE